MGASYRTMNSTEVQNPRHKMQVAEPKTPLELSVSMNSSNSIFVHTIKHCYDWTIIHY